MKEVNTRSNNKLQNNSGGINTINSQEINRLEKSIMILSCLISHSTKITKNLLKKILIKFCEFAINYIKLTEYNSCSISNFSNSLKSNIEKHGHFYSIINGIILIIYKKQNLIFEENNLTFYKKLNLDIILINRTLNPLLFSNSNLTSNFQNLLNYYKIDTISSKLSQNRQIQKSFLQSSKNSNSILKEWNPLNWNDIFEIDTISHLKNSKSVFTEMYSKFIDIIELKNEIILDNFPGVQGKVICEDIFIKKEVEEQFKDKFACDSRSEDSFSEDENISSLTQGREFSILDRLLARERKFSERET